MRRDRTRKHSENVSKALEQLSRAKKGIEDRANQFVPSTTEDESILEKEENQQKKQKKRKKKQTTLHTGPTTVPTMFLKANKSSDSPPKKKQKKEGSDYLNDIMSEYMLDEPDTEEMQTGLIPQSSNEISSQKNITEKELDIEVDDSLLEGIDDELLENVKKPIIVSKQPTETISTKEIKMPEISRMESINTEEETPKSIGDEIQMYYIDAHEERNQDEIYLFGKVFDKKSKSYISCCLNVKNMQRNIYLLPRDPTQDQQKLMEIIRPEMLEICKRNAINPSHVMYKLVKRNYAFEVAGVPHEERLYLKVVYPANFPPLKIDTQKNKVFSHVFGANTSLLELFLLKRKIKGPCWLNIKNPSKPKVGISWCRMEIVSNFEDKNISVLEQQPPAPPLKVMSLKLKTILNESKKQNEIVMASAVCHPKVSIDGPTPNMEKDLLKFTAVRRLDKMGSIPTTPELLKQLEICTTEHSLLNYIVGKIHAFDPDVIVGHNFLAFDLDILLHRARAMNLGHWSKIGRLQLKHMPKLQQGPGGMGTSTWEEKKVMAGRLVCDTYISAKEYLREPSYSLKNLAISQLNVSPDNIFSIENDLKSIAPYFQNAKGIEKLSKNNEYYAYLSMMLMFHLMLLPLTKELTNIAGNLWSKTLTGSRAERIEYLLLHEFYNRKFIVPDKEVKKKQGTEKSTKRKAQYSGGLVFEPKRGLYDKYVLLLDFNSLYPSIILERNLCFTTVKRSAEGEREIEPEVQSDGVKSVLPSIISYLLDKRRSVRNSMKKETDSNKKWQLDVRQKALKLTANSTYGCLGFPLSRFYCKAIAEMITSNGRNTLSQTRLDIEKEGHSVIYGDTDSVMILTPYTEFRDAQNLGNKIKNYINRKHRYLQIDIDGLFKRILLLTKKKYVAIRESEDPLNPGKIISTREIKGIDMVRRDWCALSKQVSNYCVEQILSGKPSEETVEAIHTYLKQIGDLVRAGKMTIDKFLLTKGLTKDPKDYPDANTLPHVTVALKMSKQLQLPVRVGQRIPYLICVSKDDKTSKSLAQRAYHPQEYHALKDKLEIDWEWYLGNQVHPPVLRLCEHIEGTDSALLAEYLGLDKMKYRTIQHNNTSEEAITSFDDDSDKFKNVNFNPVICPFCKNEIAFEFDKRILEYAKQNKESGSVDSLDLLKCQNCGGHISIGRVTNCIQRNIRESLRKFYNGWMITSSGGKSRVLSITPGSAFVDGATSNATLEFNSGDLYLQLVYYKQLFDWDRCVEKAQQTAGMDLEEHVAKVVEEAEVTGIVKEIENAKKKVERYLTRCERRYISLDSLFSLFTNMSK